MRSPQQQERGLVAILDALGASTYTDAEIARFLRSRELVVQLLNAKADVLIGELRANMIKTFIFNDTIVIVLKSGTAEPTMDHVHNFHTLLRKFMIDSLCHRILFRGAVSIGTFYVNEKSHTVMGQAVTDAAAWYDKADWFGIHATPRATILIEKLVSEDTKSSRNIIVDYAVPIKDRSPVNLKAVNWPKAFYVPHLTPCVGNEAPRPKLLSLLCLHQIPYGVESKFFNAIAFFDSIVKSQDLDATPTGRSSGRVKARR